MGYTPPLTTDVTTPQGSPVATLVGTANTESIIRANTLDQMGAPAANVSWNSQRQTTMGQGIVGTDSPDLAQLAGIQLPYVVSGCVWTADSPGSTLLCSMTAGSIMIKGILLTVAAVTSRSFTASNDTYVDFADAGTGAASITYTAVPNLQTSPALASSGTESNTLRNAVIAAGGSAVATAGIFQGAITTSATSPATSPQTTVAAGSTTHAITATPLDVASVTNFPSGGGYCVWSAATGNEQALLQFTSTSAGALNGITVVAGRAAATVTTGDHVQGAWPVGVCDTIGNRLNRTHPLGGITGAAAMTNTLTTTAQANLAFMMWHDGANPTTPLIAPFVVPAGPGRSVRFTLLCSTIASSATAGTNMILSIGTATSGGGLTTLGSFVPQVKVASDGDNLSGIAYATLAAGSYYAAITGQQSAAGTLTLSSTFATTYIIVELV